MSAAKKSDMRAATKTIAVLQYTLVKFVAKRFGLMGFMSEIKQ